MISGADANALDRRGCSARAPATSRTAAVGLHGRASLMPALLIVSRVLADDVRGRGRSATACCAAELAHRPGGQRRLQHDLVVGAVGQLEHGRRARPARARSRPGSAVGPARPALGRRPPQPRRPAGPQLVDRAAGRPSARRGTIPTRSQSRSTRSSWWLENSTGTPGRPAPRSTWLITSTATGSSPENGSSSTRTSGLVHQRRGELDPLLVAEAELLHLVVAPGGDAEPLGPALHRAPAAAAAPCRAAGRGRRAARPTFILG